MFPLIDKLFRKKEQTPPFCSAIVPAAGSSRRMGGENKLLASIGGAPVIGRTIQALESSPYISEIILAVREEDLLLMADICKAYNVSKPMKLVCGGESRMESVMAALRECDERAAFAAVHDGARPLVSRAVIDSTIERAFACGAAAPAVPVKDTIKVAVGNVVQHTPDRSTLYAIQTPQVFDIDLLSAALQAAADEKAAITDDCSAVERIGKEIYLTAGSYRNLKITTPEDLLLAEAIWLSGEI